MTYLAGFSVRVIGGREVEGRYVKMNHGQVYRLALNNRNDVRCDARVEIDGQDVGTWRLNPSTPLTLERPANDAGRFTFYKLGTTDGRQAQLSDNESLGLISVTFKPERRRARVVKVSPLPYELGGDVMRGSFDVKGGSPTMSAGGTGLSGHSGQQFSSVAELDYDPVNEVVINLRLVCQDSDPRPLTPRSTSVPPRIG